MTICGQTSLIFLVGMFVDAKGLLFSTQVQKDQSVVAAEGWPIQSPLLDPALIQGFVVAAESCPSGTCTCFKFIVHQSCAASLVCVFTETFFPLPLTSRNDLVVLSCSCYGNPAHSNLLHVFRSISCKGCRSLMIVAQKF